MPKRAHGEVNSVASAYKDVSAPVVSDGGLKRLKTDDKVSESSGIRRSAAAAASPSADVAIAGTIVAAEKFYSTTMKRKITPSLRFDSVVDVPPPQALLIIEVAEIFTEISDPEDDTKPDEPKIRAILAGIEAFIAQGLVCFLDIVEYSQADVLASTKAYLGANSAMVKLIEAQIRDGVDVVDFKKRCQERNLETVYIGGVYGGGCVWNAARKIAVNIYSKQLGETHPNIRFINKAYPFRFKHCVIWPGVTEGYDVEGNGIFAQFLRFPETAAFKVELNDYMEDEEDEFVGKFPELTGQSYHHFSETENPGAFLALHEEICRIAFLKNCLFDFFRPQSPRQMPARLIENIAEYVGSVLTPLKSK